MTDDAMHALLATLVGHRPPEAVAAVLHHAVVLLRADGTAVVGRRDVVAMFEAPDDGVRYTVVQALRGTVQVEMTVPGLPGRLGFALRGEATEGVLTRVWVEAAGLTPAAGDTH